MYTYVSVFVVTVLLTGGSWFGCSCACISDDLCVWFQWLDRKTKNICSFSGFAKKNSASSMIWGIFYVRSTSSAGITLSFILSLVYIENGKFIHEIEKVWDVQTQEKKGRREKRTDRLMEREDRNRKAVSWGCDSPLFLFLCWSGESRAPHWTSMGVLLNLGRPETDNTGTIQCSGKVVKSLKK